MSLFKSNKGFSFLNSMRLLVYYILKPWQINMFLYYAFKNCNIIGLISIVLNLVFLLVILFMLVLIIKSSLNQLLKKITLDIY